MDPLENIPAAPPSAPGTNMMPSGTVPPTGASAMGLPPIIQPPSTQPASAQPLICPRCHLPVKPEYYYCPNCGAKLSEPPLATDSLTQFLLYAFSAVLPWIAYLAVSKWPIAKYLRAPDEKAKQIGMVMLVIMVISSIIAFWLTYVWIQGYIQESLNSVNSLGL